jgi:hypothetical protein
MAVWLKMIGTTEKPCPDVYERDHVDFPDEPRDVQKGDQLVLYAVGRRTRVFAIARVTSEPYAGEHERFPFRVDIEYSINLPVLSGVPLREISSRKELVGAIQWGNSLLSLQQDEFDRAVTLLSAQSGTTAPATANGLQ